MGRKKQSEEEEEIAKSSTGGRRGSPGGPTLAIYGAGKARIVTLKVIPVGKQLGRAHPPALHI